MATVLMVNNEVSLHEMLQTSLGDLGVTVLTATTTEEAIEVCHTHQGMIHVMVTDLSLPGVNGIKLATYAATLRPHMTTMLISVEPLLNAPHPDVLPPNTIRLSKPFKLNVLEFLLRDLLAGKGLSYLFTPTSLWASLEQGEHNNTDIDQTPA